MTKAAASILSADLANLQQDCTRLLNAGVDLLHFDVMDGHFVPNISYGAPVLKCLHAALPDVYYDVHLMISDPARYAPDFAAAGASLITFHLEAVPDTVDEVIAAIRATGCKVGLSIKPATPAEAGGGCLPIWRRRGPDSGHERGAGLWRAELPAVRARPHCGPPRRV